MFSENGLDPFEHYQYVTFKVLLFLIFVATAIEVLDKHIGIKSHAASFGRYTLRLLKEAVPVLKRFIAWAFRKT